MDLPLESIHNQAFKAAEAVGCAGEQDKAWEMRDRLFQYQRALDQWSAHAEAIGVNAARFEACLASGRQAAAIRRDIDQARKNGVTGTPSFFVAVADPAGSRVKAVAFLRGAQPFAAFKAELDKWIEPGAGR